MIIEEIRVQAWRVFREAHRFELSDSLNVLVGLNEAGKSTLFEVLQRTFFDRHGGSSQELKAVQPMGSSLGPEAEIIARVGDQRYRIVKRFLQGPTSKFYSFRRDDWELDHDGDAADERIRELLNGEVPGRASREEHRGLAQALWYLQREAALPDQTWNDAVRKGLQGLVEVAAASPKEEEILRRVQEEYDSHWTPTGRVASRSVLKSLMHEIPENEAKLAELQERLSQGARHRKTLESLDQGIKEKRREEKSLREEADTLSAVLKEGETLEGELRTADEELKSRRAEEESLRRVVADLKALDDDITRAEEAVRKARTDLGDRELDEEREKGRETSIRVELQEEVGPRLSKVEERLEGLKALKDLLEQTEEKRNQQERLKRLDEAREEREEFRERIQGLLAPSGEDVAEFRAVSRKLDLTRAKAEAVAIRVAFDLSETVDISSDPPAELQESGEYLITSSTRFSLSDLGTITVSGGGEDLKQLKGELERLEDARDALQDRFGLQDETAFVKAHDEKEGLQRDLEKLDSNIETILDQGDPADELARVEERLKEKQARTRKLKEEDLGLDAPAVSREIRALSEEVEGLEARREELSSEAEKARDSYQAAIEARSEAHSALAQETSTLEGYHRQVSGLLKPYGDRKHLDSLLEEKGKDVSDQEERREDLRTAVQETVEKPRAERDDLLSQIEAIKGSLHEDEKEETKILSALETLAQGNLYSRIGDLEASLAVRKARLRTLQRRAEGGKVLRNLVQDLQEERTGVLAGPVSERLSGWLAELTDGTYDAVRLSTELKPAEVRFSRYGADLEVGELSHGTQEQLVVLLRLAIAMALSQEERQLVVLDDRLVNSDPVRMRRFRPILEEAANSCQILLATCTETPYAGLPGRVIRVPEDGRG